MCCVGGYALVDSIEYCVAHGPYHMTDLVQCLVKHLSISSYGPHLYLHYIQQMSLFKANYCAEVVSIKYPHASTKLADMTTEDKSSS